jgi:hypothetical protein
MEGVHRCVVASVRVSHTPGADVLAALRRVTYTSRRHIGRQDGAKRAGCMSSLKMQVARLAATFDKRQC